MANPLTRLLAPIRAALQKEGARPAGDLDAIDSRRQFFRRAGGAAAAAAVGTGMLMPDDAWAGIQERANQFGIAPGTLVDANGNPIEGSAGANPYIGEVMLVGYNFATRGWALCEGTLLAINSYQALFSLLGTTFGGDGRTTFGLPDLRSRAAIGIGRGPGLQDYRWGQKGGVETVTLTANEMPPHTHQMVPAAGDDNGSTDDPTNAVPAGVSGRGGSRFSATANTTMAPSTSGVTGGGQAHPNMQPFLAMNYQIALTGIFPSRN